MGKSTAGHSVSQPELSADSRATGECGGGESVLPGPGVPLRGGGGGLRKEAETLANLNPKPNSHSPSLPPGLTLKPSMSLLAITFFFKV